MTHHCITRSHTSAESYSVPVPLQRSKKKKRRMPATPQAPESSAGPQAGRRTGSGRNQSTSSTTAAPTPNSGGTRATRRTAASTSITPTTSQGEDVDMAGPAASSQTPMLPPLVSASGILATSIEEANSNYYFYGHLISSATPSQYVTID